MVAPPRPCRPRPLATPPVSSEGASNSGGDSRPPRASPQERPSRPSAVRAGSGSLSRALLRRGTTSPSRPRGGVSGGEAGQATPGRGDVTRGGAGRRRCCEWPGVPDARLIPGESEREERPPVLSPGGSRRASSGLGGRGGAEGRGGEGSGVGGVLRGAAVAGGGGLPCPVSPAASLGCASLAAPALQAASLQQRPGALPRWTAPQPGGSTDSSGVDRPPSAGSRVLPSPAEPPPDEPRGEGGSELTCALLGQSQALRPPGGREGGRGALSGPLQAAPLPSARLGRGRAGGGGRACALHAEGAAFSPLQAALGRAFLP